VVPPSAIVELAGIVQDLRSRYNLTIPFFGHAGDGNFHLVPFQPESMSTQEWEDLVPVLLTELYQRVVSIGGTISGEHGIGRKRVKYLPLAIGRTQIDAFRRVKQAFDPAGILNPGVILE
jgi:glycolate oxidase